jgi:hypothetical protein
MYYAERRRTDERTLGKAAEIYQKTYPGDKEGFPASAGGYPCSFPCNDGAVYYRFE